MKGGWGGGWSGCTRLSSCGRSLIQWTLTHFVCTCTCTACVHTSVCMCAHVWHSSHECPLQCLVTEAPELVVV